MLMRQLIITQCSRPFSTYAFLRAAINLKLVATLKTAKIGNVKTPRKLKISVDASKTETKSLKAAKDGKTKIKIAKGKLIITAKDKKLAKKLTEITEKELVTIKPPVLEPLSSKHTTAFQIEVALIQEEYPNHILLVQVGNFFEIYNIGPDGYLEDIAAVLGLRIASRKGVKVKILSQAVGWCL